MHAAPQLPLYWQQVYSRIYHVRRTCVVDNGMQQFEQLCDLHRTQFHTAVETAYQWEHEERAGKKPT